jgi:hypothetical protein
MAEPLEGPPVVPLPERLDRRLRLGPFASARDALRFVTYAAAGAVLAPFTTPYVWLVFVAGGFAASVIRSDGQSLDERAFAFVRWGLRAGAGGLTVRTGAGQPHLGQGLYRTGSGRYLAILRTGGTPVSYLPPAELAHRFELFRDLLRSTEGAFGWIATSTPMASGPVVPTVPPSAAADRPALEGYAQLVGLLCRRRQLRRVYLVLGTERTGPEGFSDLEVRVRSVTDQLGSLGLEAVRLRRRRLSEAARLWGWS